MEELEARLLFSADAAALVADATPLVSPVTDSLPVQEILLDAEGAAKPSEQAAEGPRQELVFVDAGVADHEQLVEDLRQRASVGRRIEVVVLEADRDGVSQIGEALATRRDLTTVHVVSHGTEGAIRLGSTWLSQASLAEHAEGVAGWSRSLAVDADLLFYGCDLAGNDQGRALVGSLAAMTGADVAASEDPTGHEGLGGDWELEYRTGAVESHTPVSPGFQASWRAILGGTGDSLWLNTQNPVASGGAPGLGSWTDGEVLEFGGPGLQLEPGGTSGLFAVAFDVDPWVSDGSARINGLHYVTQTVTVGSGPAFVLQEGDLVLSTAHDETIGGISAGDEDVLVFRPDTPGDYSSGVFSLLIDGSDAGLSDIQALTVVERPITVGGVALQEGDLLVADDAEDVSRLVVTATGGTTVATESLFLDASDLGIGTGNRTVGINLVGEAILLGDQNLSAGQLLLSLTDADTGIGSGTPIDVAEHDVFLLDVASAGATSSAVASHFFDGSDVALNTSEEDVHAVAIVHCNEAPALGANALTIDEGGSVLLTAADLAATDADDADGGLAFTVSGVMGGQFERASAPGVAITSFLQSEVGASDIRFVHDGGEAAPSYSVTVSDGSLSDGPAAASITFTNVNDAPSIANLGGDSIAYTEGNGAVVVEQGADAVVADVDSADLDGGELRVSIAAGGDLAEDVLSIRDQGTGAGQIGFAAGTVSYGGVAIGTASGGSLGADLVVSLNASATPAALGALVANVRYENVDVDRPTVGARTVRFSLSDGDGGTSLPRDATVTVSALNDPATAVDDSYRIDEDTSLDTAGTWYDPSWTARRRLTFDNTGQAEDLDDFPVLVVLDSGRIDYTKTQDQGQDLRFVDGDGSVLDHEIALWDEAGKSTVWVRVPRVDGASGADFIWMYYDNPTAADGQNAAGVWSSGYTAVYHLDEDPLTTGGVFDDSSASGFDAGNVGSVDSSGFIAGAQDFDGSSHWIDLGADRAFVSGAAEATFSAWIHADDLTASDVLGVTVNSAVPTTASRAGFEITAADVTTFGRTVDGGGDLNQISTTTTPLQTGRWHWVTSVIDYAGDEISIYVDGVLEATASVAFANPTTTPSVSSNGALGAEELGAGRFFDGRIDEAWIGTTARSADWIAAQYASMTDRFVGFSGEMPGAGVLDNDVDPDGDPLTAILGTGPSNAAAFSFAPDGSFTYTPLPDFFGVDSFTYRADDGSGPSNLATVTITVDPVNDAPTLGDAVLAAVDEDTTDPPGATFGGLFGAGFSDVDGSFAGVAVVANAAPAAQGEWEYSSDGATWATIGTVDDAGSALAIQASSLVRFVPAPDFDGAPTDLVLRALDDSYTGGWSTTNAGETRITVDTSSPGDPSAIAAATSRLSTSIDPVNDAPALGANALLISEGGAVVLTAGNLSASDVDDADAGLTFAVSAVTGGQFERVSAPGVPITSFLQGEVTAGDIRFVHDGGEAAPGYDVTVSDAQPLSDGPAAAAITFSNVNDAPTLGGMAGGQTTTDKLTRDPFTAVTIADADLPGDVLTVDVSLDDPGKGVLTGAFTPIGGGVYRFTGNAAAATTAIRALTFDPTENRVPVAATETTTFTIAVDDATAPTVSDGSTTVITTSINDAPTLSNVTFSVPDDPAPGLLVGAALASDPDPGDTLGWSILAGNVGGAFQIDPVSGALTVANPAAVDVDVNPVFNLTVQAVDGSATSDTAAVTVNVAGVPTPPPPEPDPIDPGPEPPPPEDEPAPPGEPDATSGLPSRAGPAAPPAAPLSPAVPTERVSAAPPEAPHQGSMRRGVPADRFVGEETAPAPVVPELPLVLDDAMLRALDLMGQDLSRDPEVQRRWVGTTVELGAAGMVAGFLTWLLRGGSLLASVLSTLPLWSRLDPLPVLIAPPRAREQEDDEEGGVAAILDEAAPGAARPAGR